MCMKTLVQSARRHGDVAHFDSRDLTVLDEEISRLENLLQAFLILPARRQQKHVRLT